MNDKARAEQLIGEIRNLVKTNSSDVARLRQLTSDLQQIASAMSSAAYSKATSAGAQAGGTGERPVRRQLRNVIDAEFKQTR